MILIIMRMKVAPEKRQEIAQTVTSLLGAIRGQEGCQRCDFGINLRDENEFCIWGEWKTNESLARYRESEPFKILLGAMSLLEKPYDTKVYRVQD